MYCSQCGQPNKDKDAICTSCNAPLYKITNEQYQDVAYNTNSLGGLIPYRNVPALAAYYTGLFSVIPLLGTPLVIAAFICGFLGLKKARIMPEVKGQVHAVVGMCVAFLGLLINGLSIATLVMALVS